MALPVAAGGDCLADLQELAGTQTIIGPVPSTATIYRLVTALADNVERVDTAVHQSVRCARQHVCVRAGDTRALLNWSTADPIDIDATLITAHSEKEHAAPTGKEGYGNHRLLAFCDHGPGGGGEPLAALLRPGNADASIATDHRQALATALKSIPSIYASRPGTRVLVRTDGASASHAFLEHLHRTQVQYSIGFALTRPRSHWSMNSPTRRGSRL